MGGGCCDGGGLFLFGTASPFCSYFGISPVCALSGHKGTFQEDERTDVLCSPSSSFMSSPFLGIPTELPCYYDDLGPGGASASQAFTYAEYLESDQRKTLWGWSGSG